MKRIWKFVGAVGHHWGILSTGGFLIGVVNLWQNTGHTIAKGIGWLIGVGALLVAFFKAWNEQYERAEALTSETQEPEAFMLPPPPPELEKIDAEFAAEEPKPRLSVEVVRAETTLIGRDNFGSFEERPDGSAAVVMSFKNQLAKPGHQNETFRRVTANLTFVGSDRTEHIDYGNWLNEYARYVDFRPGETHTLVIAMHDQGTGEVVGLFNQKTTDPRKGRFRSGYTVFGPEHRCIPQPPCEVTISLVSGGTTLFSDEYVLSWTAYEFEFSRKDKNP